MLTNLNKEENVNSKNSNLDSKKDDDESDINSLMNSINAKDDSNPDDKKKDLKSSTNDINNLLNETK